MKATNTITLAQAIDWTSNWRSAPTTAARAFLIPIQDLLGAISEIQGQSGSPMARAYLAINNNNVEKLVIVGTTQETLDGGTVIYRDMLPSAGDRGVGAGTSKIWDFTEPCPPECDPRSPLN